jgi:hypothetical protein
VEPALIINQAGAYVDSLNLANADRTRATAPEGCPEITWPHDIGQIFVSSRCVRGDVKMKPGYNTTILVNAFENAIEVSAFVGAGEGEVCSQPKLFSEESPPVGDFTTLLDGSLLCNQTIRSIDGVGGRFLDFLGGAGVNVQPVPEENKIILDADMAELVICFTESESDSDSV